MQQPALPFTVTDWNSVPATRHPGETGEALWRTFQAGELRVRLVEYSPGYLADHGDAAHRSSTPTGARLFVVD
jgi:hypothetical protein